MSERFDYLKKVVDGIDKNFIEESADSMLVEEALISKTLKYDAEDFVVVKEKSKNKFSGMIAGLTVAAAVLVCAVSVSAYMLIGGNGISVMQSGGHVSNLLPQEDPFINKPMNDDRVNFTMNTLDSTYDAVYFYNWLKKVDLNNKLVLPNCNINGCEHNNASCELSERKRRNTVTAYGGGFYYCEDSYIYYEKDGKKQTVILNPYSTEFSNETYKNGKTIYNIILLDNEKLLLVGANYIFTVDVATKSIGECIKICEAQFRDMALAGDIFIANDINGNLFTANIKTGEVKKQKEHIYSVQAIDGKVYYVNEKDEKKTLCYSDVDFTSEEYIADGVTEIFATKDRLCYIKETDKNTLYFRSFENMNDEKVLFNLQFRFEEVFTVHYFPSADTSVVACYNRSTEEMWYKVFVNGFEASFDIKTE